MVIIVAAGNKGPKPMSLSPISEFAECVCVGCHDGEYTSSGMQKLCSDYSGRGPSKGKYILLRNSNPLKKPDIVAPGSNIISCNYINVSSYSKWGVCIVFTKKSVCN